MFGRAHQLLYPWCEAQEPQAFAPHPSLACNTGSKDEFVFLGCHDPTSISWLAMRCADWLSSG
jgi:hypothetical protein